MLAGGTAYWVSAATRALFFVTDEARISRVLSAEATPKAVAAADASILVLGAAGLELEERVAFDWVRLTEARGQEVFGVAEDEQGNGKPFAVHVGSHAVRWVE